MRIGGYIFPSFNPYDRPCFEIYISGCTRKCKGCHNIELANFDYGTEIENMQEWINKFLLTKEAFFDIISITGGDILCQPEEKAYEFIDRLSHTFPNKEIWVFTGEDDFRNIPNWMKERCDVIKYGSYKEELKVNKFPITSNQKIWRKNEY